jgi:hypothetical protein
MPALRQGGGAHRFPNSQIGNLSIRCRGLPIGLQIGTGLVRQATPDSLYPLTRRRFSVNCIFLMASIAQIVPTEVTTDFAFPQREAAFFYGLFLRGHSPEQLRRDIEVPQAVLLKWHRDAERDPELRDIFYRMVEYRRHVLAIFDSLVGWDAQKQRVQ